MMGVTTALKPRRPLKIEKPRPLKLSSMTTGDHNLESVLSEMDLVAQSLQSGMWDQRVLYPAITSLCENLKMFGPQLENVYKDQLDKCYIWLRTGCRDDRLSLAARYRLLEIIELRAMNWKPNQNLISYYQTKLQHIEAEEAAMEEQTELASYMTTPQASTLTVMPATMATTPMQTPTTPSAPLFPQHPGTIAPPHLQYGSYPQPTIISSQPQTLIYGQYTTGVIPVDQYQQQLQQVSVVATAPLLSPGEVVRTSGKFSKPTRIAGKNYCKDEVVIRNQDSGKVMGIKGRRVHMIEELSETIISFQRVAPGARERLVQITGPSEDNINQAKQLIEDTIRRNASPVREAHSLSSGGSSVFSSSPLNGSNSSIASHTDDDNNSLSGCKRNTLMHSMSGGDSGCGGDTCMGDYRYTVAHNNHAIRITGNNLKMVRTAKLVLDEYFNGERNLNNIAQLLAADGCEPLNPSNPPATSLTPPPSSSTPPMLVKPATPPATPPPVSSDGEGGEPHTNMSNGTNSISGTAIKGDESPKNGGVAIVRQPLFPSSSKEAMDVAEICTTGTSSARFRRAAFAKTSEERNSTSDDEAGGNDGGVVSPPVNGYPRKSIVKLATTPASRLTPGDWASVVKNNPELIKKGSVYQGGVVATMNEHGASSINGAPTYLQPGDLINPMALNNWMTKWATRSHAFTDDDNRNSQ